MRKSLLFIMPGQLGIHGLLGRFMTNRLMAANRCSTKIQKEASAIRIRRTIIIGLALAAVLACGFVWKSYNDRSSVEKVLSTDGTIVEQVNFDQGRIALVDTGERLKAVYLEKHLLGWRKEIENGPILKEAGSYRELFSFFYSGEYTFIYGYDAGRQIDSVSFTETTSGTGVHETSHRNAGQLYWSIVLPKPINRITPENLTITTIQGEQVEYPFSELDRFLE